MKDEGRVKPNGPQIRPFRRLPVCGPIGMLGSVGDPSCCATWTQLLQGRSAPTQTVAVWSAERWHCRASVA